MPNHNASPGRGTLFFLSAAVGGLYLLITAVLNGQTAGFYPKALEAFAAVRGTGPDAFFLAVTWLGSFYLLAPPGNACHSGARGLPQWRAAAAIWATASLNTVSPAVNVIVRLTWISRTAGWPR